MRENIVGVKLCEDAEKEFKRTVMFLASHYDDVRTTLSNRHALCHDETDEIMSCLASELINGDDFEAERTEHLDLRGYILYRGGLCVKRMRSINKKNQTLNWVKDESGEDVEMITLVACKEAEIDIQKSENVLSEQLKALRSCRYKYGWDIFECLYVRLITLIECNDVKKGEEVYKKFIEINKVSRSKLDEVLMNVVKAIAGEMEKGKNPIIEVEKYVYSHENIKSAVYAMM